MGEYVVRPNFNYTRLTDVPVPATKIQNVYLQYLRVNPFMNITVDSVHVVPDYLGEPYRSKLTKKFKPRGVITKPGSYPLDPI